MPITPVTALLEYFPSGTTEGEHHILREAFIQAEEYSDFITPPPHNPRLLVGKKGSGKSAVIDFSISLFSKLNIPAILVRPKDIDLSTLRNGAAVGEMTRIAYDALIQAIAQNLGSDLSGLVSEEQKVLLDSAVKNGNAKRDIIERLANILPRIAKPLINTDLSVLLPETQPLHREELQTAISNNLRTSGKGFYLFVDDTDQVASPDDPAHLNRIWAFILAIRNLTEKFETLRAVISLREEVWRRLISDKAGQRDQTDHFIRLVRTLNPTQEHITRIIEKRLSLAARLANARPIQGEIYSAFFEGSLAKMPSSDELSSWEDLIIGRSRGRPRDAIQLVNALAQRAKDRKASHITEGDLASVMPSFSKQRVSLVKQEVESECPQIEDVIRTLAKIDFDHGSFKAKTQTIREHLRKIPTTFSTLLFGRALRSDNDEDALHLWRFLWENGILNARISDTRRKHGFRHVFPEDDIELVSKARWNDLQAVIWEVNPAYRDYLMTVQKDDSARTGLPPRSRRNSRR
jgi:hypothetical protein